MRIVRWAAEGHNGLEHLVVNETKGGIVADGVVIGDRFGRKYGIRYTVQADRDWVVTGASVEVLGGGRVALLSNRQGNWSDADGTPLGRLTGCVDVDISATPFTNTLPISRLQLSPGAREVLKVVYIRIPELRLDVVEQAYTCLESAAKYRHEGLTSGFETVLDVDEDGLVVRYPSLFVRMPE